MINPYQPPAAPVADAGETTQPVRLFAVSGRIGRARYIAYGFGIYALFLFVSGLIAGALGQPGIAVMMAAWIALAVIGMMLTIQRCHDFNMSGWLSLLIIVPIVNLMFLFIPGTDGPNRFGPPTPPNSAGVLIIAWLIPGVMLAGVIAAIALPALQQYLQR